MWRCYFGMWKMEATVVHCICEPNRCFFGARFYVPSRFLPSPFFQKWRTSQIAWERKTIDKALKFLSANPRHPSLNVHKAKNVKGKYAEGGNDIFIAYASKNLRLTFEYGPEPGMIALRNCGHHESSERKIWVPRYFSPDMSSWNFFRISVCVGFAGTPATLPG